MMIKYLIGGAIAVFTSHCQPPATTNDRPPCEGQVIYAHDDETIACDISPPQQLHLIISLPADYQAICDDHGGWIYYTDPTIAHCADIDY